MEKIHIKSKIVNKNTIDFKVKIIENNGWLLVIANKIFYKNEIVDTLLNLPIVSYNTKYNITKSEIEFFDTTNHFSKKLNHSCDPNLIINTNTWNILAKKNINFGDELTFNYLQTEFIVSESFQCSCKSSNCYGYIQGYKFLTKEQKNLILQEYQTPLYFIEK